MTADLFRVLISAAQLVAASIGLCVSLAMAAAAPAVGADRGLPLLFAKVAAPEALLVDANVEGKSLRYAGDLRMGDLDGDGQVDFVVYRSTDGGIKPCFLGAFDLAGKLLWTAGAGGGQPVRPGSLTVYDVDGDRCDEVICFFCKASAPATPGSFGDTVIQIRDGKTGEVRHQATPDELARWKTGTAGSHGNWCHQRILVANFRGEDRAADFVVKIGFDYFAFDDQLQTLWHHRVPSHVAYEHCAYVPAVGDIDGDGHDELFGGHVMIDHDGACLWYKVVAHHMDSVAVLPWDNGRMRAIGSGYGQVLDASSMPIVRLGEEAVPHGQEVRVADFLPNRPGPEMVIRYNGHLPDVMLVDNTGTIMKRFRLNSSPNETGLEAVLWNGAEGPALLLNGGALWTPTGERLAKLPGLPPPAGPKRTARTMAWYHCIPADVCGDEREEAVLYNPWDRFVWIYTAAPLRPESFSGYTAGPRQYNVRLMD